MSYSRLHRLVLVFAALVVVVCHVEPAAARSLRIKRVSYSGVRTAPLAALRQAVAPAFVRGRLSPPRRRKVARRVAVRLRRALRQMGYLRATVRVTEHQPGAHTSFVVLRARVKEGKRFRIGALDVTGVGPAIRLKALSRVKLRSGQFFDTGDLDRSTDAVATVLADRGHAFVRVTVGQTPHKRQSLIDLTFGVRPGPVVWVDRIVILGASVTGARLVRRGLILRSGARYHRTTLLRGLARLRQTGAFKTLRLTESALGKKRVKIVVRVVEAKP
jgi:outer membrane protein assembly factor BamA